LIYGEGTSVAYQDQETNIHYNYFRDYEPGTGRYLQSDAIGLTGGLNTYAHVNGNPLSYIDPLGLEVFVAGHFAVPIPGGILPSGGYVFQDPPAVHLSLQLIPDDPTACVSNNLFAAQPNGTLLATLGAQYGGSLTNNAPYGNLVSAPNYPGDAPTKNPLRIPLQPPCGMTDTQFIIALIKAAASYKNSLPYHPLPTPTSPTFNSDSYVAGVLRAAGARPPSLNAGGMFQAPGYHKPIPLANNTSCTCR
jgi:RHS repeat-associated protein